MVSQNTDTQQGLALTLVFGVVALIITAVTGVTVHQHQYPHHATLKTGFVLTAVADTSEPVVLLPADLTASASATQAALDAASVVVDHGVVKFYFESGESNLAVGALAALSDMVKRAQSGHKLVISGFHDATGNAAKNADLAKQRALVVRDALMAAGVSKQKIKINTPEEMAGNVSDAEARRVEITIE